VSDLKREGVYFHLMTVFLASDSFATNNSMSDEDFDSPESLVFFDCEVNSLLLTLFHRWVAAPVKLPNSPNNQAEETEKREQGKRLQIEEPLKIQELEKCVRVRFEQGGKFEKTVTGSFYNFFLDFTAQFSGVSFGDKTFAEYISLFARKEFLGEYHRALWSEPELFRLFPQHPFIDLSGYLFPLEEKPEWLTLYRNAIQFSQVSSSVAPFFYWVAIHHLSYFVFAHLYLDQDANQPTVTTSSISLWARENFLKSIVSEFHTENIVDLCNYFSMIATIPTPTPITMIQTKWLPSLPTQLLLGSKQKKFLLSVCKKFQTDQQLSLFSNAKEKEDEMETLLIPPLQRMKLS